MPRCFKSHLVVYILHLPHFPQPHIADIKWSVSTTVILSTLRVTGFSVSGNLRKTSSELQTNFWIISMNSGRGKEKWKHVRTWLEAFEKFLLYVTNTYCASEFSKGKCLLGGWWDSRKLLWAEHRGREGEVTAQLEKSVEALLASQPGCRGIRCYPLLLHAPIHKKPLTLLMSLLWHIINAEAAVHVLFICCGVCNWIGPSATLKMCLSIPKDVHMF